MKDLSPSVVSNCLSPVERFTVKTSRTHLEPPPPGTAGGLPSSNSSS